RVRRPARRFGKQPLSRKRRIPMFASSTDSGFKRLRLALKAFALLIAMLSPSAAVFAQSDLSGTVSDPSGDGVGGARVTLLDGSGSILVEARTGPDGTFELRGVPRGTYRVVVEAPGFTQSQPAVVSITGAAPSPLTIQLEIAAVADQMVVTASRTES